MNQPLHSGRLPIWSRGPVWFAGSALILLFVWQPVQALGPENTAVVVNAESWASTWIANEYVHARRIPPANVIYLSKIPDLERLSVQDFRELVLQPILKTIAERGLAEQIECIAYSADFPAAIDVSADVAGRPLPPILTTQAALNGLTYLHEQVRAKDVRYLDLNANFYARRILSATADSPWTADEQKKFAEVVQRWQSAAQQFKRAQKRPADPKEAQEKPPDQAAKDALLATVKEAIQALRELTASHPHSADLHYNLACGLAVTDQADEALAALHLAVNCGWWNVGHAERDDDFRPIRDRAEFKTLLMRMKEAKLSVQPTTAFSARRGWQSNGDPAAPGQGARYLLSTLLACTSGRGNSAREAVAGLRSSAAADYSRPPGTVYFMQNGDVRSTTREWAFARAAEQLRELGVASAVLPGILPTEKLDVAGAMIGIADFNWASSRSKILPGAICEHLTSFGGVLHEGAGQTPLTEFLRYGAAGASGTVTEPFALQAKFPTPFLHVHYARGCSLAEAFYQSVAGPYQLLVVGDPLCKPWAKRLQIAADGLSADEPVAGTVMLAPHVSGWEGIRPDTIELYVDGLRTLTAAANATIDWNTTQVADGVHQVSLVAFGNDPVRSSGRRDFTVVVSNQASAFVVSSPDRGEIPWTQRITLNATQPGAEQIRFLHNGRVVGCVLGENGSTALDPRVLGAGPVRIIPVAILAQDAPGRPAVGPPSRPGDLRRTREIHGVPLDFVIIPPPALKPSDAPQPTELLPGFHVSAAARPKVLVTKVDANWLHQAGVQAGESVRVEGWIQVPEDDTCQFQWRGNVEEVSIHVDEVRQDWVESTGWHFVPVALAAGLHRVRLEFRAVDGSTLDLRFGGRGTQRLSGELWRHVAP